jgi:hypothetical protein
MARPTSSLEGEAESLLADEIRRRHLDGVIDSPRQGCRFFAEIHRVLAGVGRSRSDVTIQTRFRGRSLTWTG